VVAAAASCAWRVASCPLHEDHPHHADLTQQLLLTLLLLYLLLLLHLQHVLRLRGFLLLLQLPIAALAWQNLTAGLETSNSQQLLLLAALYQLYRCQHATVSAVLQVADL
jgi:hypothetical protein